MGTLWQVFKRELCSYFLTPIAYAFTLLLLILSGISTFYLGDFYQCNQADQAPLFDYVPWLFALLLPILAVRMWSIERQAGSIEFCAWRWVPPNLRLGSKCSLSITSASHYKRWLKPSGP